MRVCEREKARVSVCWAAQSEPRVEVVFLPPMVSLGLCVCARLGQPGAIGGGLGSGGRRDEAREGWKDRRSAGVSLGKVQVWANGQTERWKERGGRKTV